MATDEAKVEEVKESLKEAIKETQSIKKDLESSRHDLTEKVDKALRILRS